MLFILLYLVTINIVTFFLFGADKQKAKKGKWRIPEKTLMTASLFGGSIGAMCGMKVFNHKTRNAKFAFGIPAIFSIELVLFIIMFLV